MPRVAHASPTKDFFISMITKDITLTDCILDLLDNCIDGARKQRKRQRSAPSRSPFRGCRASISFSKSRFSIQDNCGGIPIDDAVNYAFHFGRRLGPAAPRPPKGAIGLYGIGMKRAIFKIGRDIDIRSSTETEAFRVPIDVEKWARPDRADDWDFPLYERQPGSPGTTIEIETLNEGIADELTDPTFATQLISTIARDYSLFLDNGFEVEVNDHTVRPYSFALLESSKFMPVRYQYKDDGVHVEVLAGVSQGPPDDLSPPENATLRDVEYYGWFVACNDRIVLAGDKTSRTVWGDDGFQRWHYQYNGFLGMVKFNADDPTLLPWTTTKREVDPGSSLYRRAIVKMKKASRAFIQYTTERKGNIPRARQLEDEAVRRPLADLKYRRTMKLPSLTKAPRVTMANISYAVPKAEADDVAEALGDPTLTNRRIGEKTFRYYYKREVGG